MVHLAVLKKEVIQYLEPEPGENFVDATIGEGGHTREILKKNYPGKVLGIEIDPKLYKTLKEDLKRWPEKERKRLILVNDSYANLDQIVKKKGLKKIAGVLFDLGISSWHLEKSKRGFSFLKKEPLIMNYNLKKNPLSAKEIINSWPIEKIEKIIREYGQERFAKKIAKKIEEARKIAPIENTLQLVEIIKRAIPKRYRNQRIHFSTRTFQALRIATNNELENLKKGLIKAWQVLEKGGRLVVISFHSLEDKIVKEFFIRKVKKGEIKILTKKPIVPTAQEIKLNPRSRSAKLRAGLKI